MSVLRIRDADGKFVSILTIKGDKGDRGEDAVISEESITNALGYTPADTAEVARVEAIAAEANNKADVLRDAVTRLNSNVIADASGEVISLTDASDMELSGLKIFGRTIQDGTPSTESPVKLESVGAGGSIGVTVAGKNLLRNMLVSQSISGITVTTNSDGSVKVNGKASGYASCPLAGSWPSMNPTPIPAWLCRNVSYKISGASSNVNIVVYFYRTDLSVTASFQSGTTFDIPDDAEFWCVALGVAYGITVTNEVIKPFLTLASVTADVYEPYKTIQTLTASTPNGLPGIPVTSGGNYTDKDGQQWVCDEVDFGRGVYVQRVNKAKLSVANITRHNHPGNSNLYRFNLSHASFVPSSTPHFGMCTGLLYDVAPLNDNSVDNVICGYMGGNIYARCDAFESAEAFKEWATENDIELAYTIATPIETALSAEELAAYAALHTNYPNTTIYNDAGAHMAVDYAADTKAYIDNKLAAVSAALINM